MSNQNVNAASSGKFSSLFASILIPVALVIGYLIFTFVLGNPGNFEGNDPTKHPHPGNLLGMMYKGGILVPILMANFIIVICVIIERFITLNVASGKGSIPNFVRKVKGLLDSNNVDAAITECDKQKGSVANVIREGLHKYKEMGSKSGLDKEQKVLAIQKEIEEATSLELPMLEKNLVILATISSVATLLGLLGTVFGMIRAFSAIATAGAPDAVALSNGISEALINTALGISSSAVSIIAYNYFTTKIDGLTYGIDEAGFSIAQNFAAKHA
ncbi:MAG: MotA/TolQ/ExbB proton channel family protein [Saprospiraceae bacterium]|jgi:biopolymer transport protein ExbB|nr:MotA/TolQ/ExbB proton channel family protein [Candidatus Defluviibacterium haderslevense]MCC7027186.1 MotA/TolQ/ExbB proton channel family protein [Saprospiraceae bacterium]MBK7245218.1 MotA/TolQ/ExbB proton channel family protein [Candidatus Defluviibacterium haderslevense]MBK8243700.1 MotA/TolQ/ExbB proton channel family protein [Candidatus Defluviibacterium haderslevense]MBL0235634.1 MotA/TolQ/ExbB proton channel family protein [Candidatus Defluviibacterium haderslevense]